MEHKKELILTTKKAISLIGAIEKKDKMIDGLRTQLRLLTEKSQQKDKLILSQQETIDNLSKEIMELKINKTFNGHA